MNELNYFGKITETGLTVTAKVYDSSGVQVGADVACTEAGALSIYIGDMPTAPIGQYGVRFFNGSVLLGQGFINWDGTKEIDFNLDSTISSRLASVDYVEADNTSIAAIKTKTDTLVNTDLTGIALSSEIAALNDFNPTLDTVARVTLVDTTTVNTDMRGTDGANTVAPDNASIASILVDTNELQTNQGNFATATGFSTPTDVSNAQTAIISEVNANETKIDAIETKAQADIRQTALLAQHTATQGLITALNDLSAADVNTQVDAALLDYDGPTKAELDAAQSAIESAISGLNNLDSIAVSQAVWDYLQSSTTVTASMKEAVEITLKNAKLIPATI